MKKFIVMILGVVLVFIFTGVKSVSATDVTIYKSSSEIKFVRNAQNI